MSTILMDHVDPRTSETPAQRLRLTTAAVRVSFSWFGVRKTLTPEQKSQAAESFGAEGDSLSAGKKLLDTRHPAYKQVTAVRGQVVHCWKGSTLPYPEPGIRLIQRHKIESFNQQLVDFKAELEKAVGRLDEHYGELQTAAQKRLGDLFNPADYPPTLRGLFDLAWEFPSVQPAEYLLQLNPAIYEQEKARVAARFEEAVRLAEQAFTTEFAKLVSRLTERLSTSPEGDRKIFRDSAIGNLTEFFDRFRQLNVDSTPQLDELVNQAQQAIHGVQPQDLRDNASLRQHIATSLAGVQASLEGMLVDRPRRRIIRNEEMQP
jgi:hypothetical protein